MIELRFAIRYTHIIAGAIVLVAFWIPILATKGSRLHIWSGRIAVGVGSVAAVSALITCIWGLIDVDYAVGYRELSPQDRSELIVEVRYLYSLLAVLSLMVLHALRFGIRLVRTREAPEKLRNTESWIACSILFIAGAAAIVFGVFQMSAHGFFSRYLFLVFVGIVSSLSAIGDWQFMCNPRPTPMAWWYKHMECMLGSFIAFLTAFAIFGLRSLIDQMPYGLFWLPWILPSVIGIPVIGIWTQSYRKKFDELSSKC